MLLRNSLHILKLKSISLTILLSPNFSKRFMLRNKTNQMVFTLIPKISPRIISRQPSFVAQGTLIKGSEYSQILKIIHWHNNYLFNLNFKEDIDLQTFQFYKKIMFVNPKFFQHMMSVLYPNAEYSTLSLQKFNSNVPIDCSKETATEDVVVAATAGAVMKKSSIFVDNLIVLACQYNLNEKKTTIHKKALMQTNQEHPDFIYNTVYKLKDKQQKIWERFYDFKTGKIEINSGHILCFSNLNDYEYEVRQLLNGQLKKYDHITTIKNKLQDLIMDKSLTWAERNTKFQAFIPTILHEHPEINPSFILYNPLLYEVENRPIPSHLQGIIKASSFATIEDTQKVLATAIVLEGKTCQENYMNHPYKSPFIVGLIKELLANHT